MNSRIEKNKLIFVDGKEYILTKEIYDLYSLQTTEITLNSDLTFDCSVGKAIYVLRKLRDKKLLETDTVGLSDTTKINTTSERTALKAQRVIWRDLPETLSEEPTLEEVLRKIKEL